MPRNAPQRKHLQHRRSGSPKSFDIAHTILAGLPALCRACEVYPCILDAAIFSSYDSRGWTEENLIWWPSMAKSKRKPASPFAGLWHIVSMTGWDEDYFNEEVQAFLEFEDNGTGHFQFGYVRGYMDWRPTTRDGEPAVEWSWEGSDGADMTEMTGRGWAKLKGGELDGMIFIHLGDESGFVAKRAPAPKSGKRKKREG